MEEWELVLDISHLEDMAADILDLRPDGWDSDIYFEVSKLMEECGEAAECLNKSKKLDEDLADELADIIIAVSTIALKKKIDLNKALISKQGKRVKKLLDRFHRGVCPGSVTLRYRINYSKV